MLDTQRLVELRDRYRDTLLEDVLPFWMRHIRDDEMGGYLHHVDADGSTVSTDKCFWVTGRTVWTYSRCYNEVEARPEWLDFARHGYEFMLEHGFDADGRMFYTVTRGGTVANTVKCNNWKAPFHLPRALLNVWRLLDVLLED